MRYFTQPNGNSSRFFREFTMNKANKDLSLYVEIGYVNPTKFKWRTNVFSSDLKKINLR